jgi:enoyl-CoA hydratase/carnithine racemase
LDTFLILAHPVPVKGMSPTARVAVMDVSGAEGWSHRNICLNRPGQLNCLSLAMLGDLRSAIETAHGRALVLTGAGRAFCSGLDLKEVSLGANARAMLVELVAVYQALLQHPAPVVVLAQGFAVGGGAGLLACADQVMVTDDFRFRLPTGALARLAAVVVPVCELRAPGKRPTAGWPGCDLNAAEARTLGLVDSVVPRDELSRLAAAPSGLVEPNFRSTARHDPPALTQALASLDRFLVEFDAQPPAA